MKQKLKIAQIAPIIERIPPKKYGGTERIVYGLTEELVRKGHDVTLFASGDSATSARLVSVYPRALREARVKDIYGLNEMALYHIGNAYIKQEEFDIIHDHNNQNAILAAHFSKTPVVMTLHGDFNMTNRLIYSTLGNAYFVCISKSQSERAKHVNIFDVIYNGLEMEHYPFEKKHNGFMLFVGRISMEKGPHFAIDVAEALNIPLILAAKLDPIDKPYYREYIEPRLYGKQIEWIGEVDEHKRNKLMSQAICILHPVTWREPFGLTMIEAMACGCPVVAFNKGSIPEIVVNGKTGFVVADTDEMTEAVTKIDTIDREECRKYSLSHFSAKKMADNYERVYYDVLNIEQKKKDEIPMRNRRKINKYNAD